MEASVTGSKAESWGVLLSFLGMPGIPEAEKNNSAAQCMVLSLELNHSEAALVSVTISCFMSRFLHFTKESRASVCIYVWYV